MSQPELLSASQSAAIIGKSTATVKRLAKSGALPAELFGAGNGVYIFKRADVEAYAAARRAELVDTIAKLDAAS